MAEIVGRFLVVVAQILLDLLFERTGRKICRSSV